MRAVLVRAVSSVVLALPIGGALAAQGWIEPIRPVPGGGLIERVRSEVQIAVTGRVARVTVEEWFRNGGVTVGEGTYIYPLAGEAVFSSFSLWQGEQELRGETMDASQARAIYESIVRRRRDPALIELAGHGMVRARVFPINPGDTRKVTLRYTQLLDRVGDAWRLRYAGSAGSSAPRSLRVTVDSASRFGEPYSPTHGVHTSRRGDGLDVTVTDSTGPSDVELFLPLARGIVGTSVMTHHPAGEDGYFMLLLAPGRAAQATVVPRDVVMVLDISGSMSGEKLAQAKAALTQLVGTLRTGDRFRLIAFSNSVRRFREDWTAVTADARRDAGQWIEGLDANGGTNIAGALAEAFSQAPAEGSLGVVVFLTDGLPTVGDTDPERITTTAERDRGAFRVFSFGIGYDVNTFLLDRLSERARGTTEYLRPGTDIEAAVGDLAAKIASPMMTDLSLTAGSGVELYDVEPQRLPDLFAGDEMVVFGRYRGVHGGEWDVTVHGRRNGQQEEFRTVTVDQENDGARYLEQLWAARKVGSLTSEIRLHGANPELLQSLKDIALRYGILTEYTAYLVQEPGAVATGFSPPPGPAPFDQVGARAVERADEASALSRSRSVAALAPTAAEQQIDQAMTTGGRAGINPTRRIGGHLFMLRDSVWTDLRHGDSLRVVTIAPYSDAYFALLRALPELTKPAALAPAVLVAGRRISIKIETGGRESWSAGELASLVRDFRS